MEENTLKDDIDIEKITSIKWDTEEEVWRILKRKSSCLFKSFIFIMSKNLPLKEIAKHLNLTESNVKHYLL